MASFKPAKSEDRKVKLALTGPSGSGKTFTALQIASGLGDNIGVVDSEYGRAHDYAESPLVKPYQVMELDRFSPLAYKAAVEAAVKAKFDVIILDSISHEWIGKGGCLEMIDTSGNTNSFAAWSKVTPLHNQFMVSMVSCPVHLIVTLRTKTEYVLEENERGKLVPRKVGLKPVQRDGVEYEFPLWGEIDIDHNLHFTKVHGHKHEWLQDREFATPGQELGRALIEGPSALEGEGEGS